MASSPIDEIKDRIDVVDLISQYVKVKKVGSNYQALCPFHSEKTPSFFISPSKQIWKCFGCQKGGNIFDFVMEMEGLSFQDALKQLAQRAGIELKAIDPSISKEKKDVFRICELAAKFFQKQLHNSVKGKEALQYLKKRGLKDISIYDWHIGYAPNTWSSLLDFLKNQGFPPLQIEKAGLIIKNNSAGSQNFYDRFRSRIMFPIFNAQGKIIGFGGRIFGVSEKKGVAKYMNSPQTIIYDKSKVLYGMHKAKVEIKRQDSCILTEGYFDVILSHQEGMPNTVGVSGTALTPYHAKELKRYCGKVLCAFDMDIAGNKATERSVIILQKFGFDVKVVLSDKDKDPADMIVENPDKWKKLVSEPLSIAEFYIKVALMNYDKQTLDGKKKIGDFVLPAIKRIQNKIEQAHWIQTLSQELDVKEDVLYEQMKSVKIDDYSIDFSDNEAQGSAGDKDSKNGENSSDNFSKENKRISLLEDFLAAILYKYPQFLYLIPQDLDFFSGKIKNYITALKEDKEQALKNILKDDNIIQLMQSIPKEDFNPEAEINYCIREIKNIKIKEKLYNLSKKIAESEKNNNIELIRKLTEEFNNLASQII